MFVKGGTNEIAKDVKDDNMAVSKDSTYNRPN